MKYMTNEQKAEEISEQHATSRYFPNDEETAAYDAAMQMAKWTDEQYAKAFAPILIELDELKHQVKSLLS